MQKFCEKVQSLGMCCNSAEGCKDHINFVLRKVEKSKTEIHDPFAYLLKAMHNHIEGR